MNLEEYNADSLRRLIRDLQEENNELRRQLRKKNIPTAESHLFQTHRNEELYDPDQGSRIERPWITEKMVQYFYNVFHGRKDVYARRGKKGVYYPQCANGWSRECPWHNGDSRFCLTNQCPARRWKPLNGNILRAHLLGMSESGDDAIGLYPLFEDGTCSFLVFDFDNHEKGAEKTDYSNRDEKWKDEVDALRLMCRNNGIDALVERSRSGRGAHVWIIFSGKVKASVARAFGTGLLNHGARSINLISFQYYDRMYPSQDSSDGIGNLIALPLQGRALRNGNTAFVDENWNAYPDQWGQLSRIHRYTEQDLLDKLVLWQQDESVGENGSYTVIATGKDRIRPWESRKLFRKSDVTGVLHVILADGVYIDALNLKPGIQNQIRCLAAFSNPKYQENKALGHSNYATPSVQYLGKDVDGYIRIPRGLLGRLVEKCNEAGIAADIQNKRSIGRPIKVAFSKELYLQQDIAAQQLMQFDDGILSAATAFGKTAVCSYLIASRRVSTLILLRSKTLLSQWIDELNKFLVMDEPLPEYKTPTGRLKKRNSIIGTMKGGVNKLTGIIDIALVDYLCGRDDLKELLQNYGMVIMDECHHGASAGAQIVLEAVSCKYLYGVSATPVRGDHLEKINYMLLGQIRSTYSAKERAADQGIDHLVRPRFTRIADTLEKNADINEKYELLRDSTVRNDQIIRDIRTCVGYGRTVAVITKYKEHAKFLADSLRDAADHVELLYGDNTEKENNEIAQKLPRIPDSESVILIATGQKIGEGFNFPRLDTLILGTPISDPGRVEQYVGRLNRDYNEEHILFMILEMKNAGISVVTTKEYGSHFAVIDYYLVWYGGMNLLGKEDVWDNLMRIRDAEAAQELLRIAQEEINTGEGTE